MLARMGFGKGAPSGLDAPRLLPTDIDAELEFMVSLMIRVLFIEVSAFHTFRWAEAWMSDPELVAGDGAAARLVSHIRADETPHVGYLAVALTELRDRTWIGASGRHYPGSDLIGRLWDHFLDQSLGAGRAANRKAVLGEVEHWCRLRPNGDDLVAEFHSLAGSETDEASRARATAVAGEVRGEQR
jgi:hypothetical protein